MCIMSFCFILYNTSIKCIYILYCINVISNTRICGCSAWVTCQVMTKPVGVEWPPEDDNATIVRRLRKDVQRLGMANVETEKSVDLMV